MAKLIRQKIPDDIILKIYLEDDKVSNIATKYGVSQMTVTRIKKLAYPRYAEIINAYKKNKELKQSKRIKLKKIPLKDKSEEIKTIRIEEKIKNFTPDMLKADLVAVLSNYFTPLILKFLLDNILSEKQFEELIDTTAKKIREENNQDFYVDAVKTLLLGLMLQVVKEEHIPSLISGPSKNK